MDKVINQGMAAGLVPGRRPSSPAQGGAGRRPLQGWQPPSLKAAAETHNGFFAASLAFYIFLLSSLLNEFLVSYAGVHLPLVAIIFSFILAMYLLAGNAFRFFRTPFALPWIALLVWWMIAGMTGFYRTRSLEYLFPYAIRLHTLPLIICAIAPDLRGLRKVLFGAGFGIVAVLVFCFKFGQMSDDRFVVPDTSLANANDLGMRLLLYGVMFLVFLTAGWKGRLLTLVTLPILSYYVLRTGSRSNLITLALLILIALFVLPMQKKLMIVMIAVVVPLFAIPFLPSATTHRLLTFFSSDAEKGGADAELTEHAVDSTNARLQLQQRALELTLSHLVLGVGPLNFQDAVEEMVQTRYGSKSGWQVAHNSYLQVSAESGLPGLLFYAWSIWLCLRLNYKSFRKSTGDRNLISFTLLLASFVYAEGVFFCSIPYDYFLALLVGLTATNYLGSESELKTIEPLPAPVSMPKPFQGRPPRLRPATGA